MSGRIRIEFTGSVSTIELSGEDEGNALTNDDLRDLEESLETAVGSGCSVIVVKGASGQFCRGRFLGPEAERAGDDGPSGIEERNAGPVLRAFAALVRVPVPVVASVSGKAWGLGCALAAACDITYAAAGATFSLPEMNRGLPPTLALSVLRDLVPHKALVHLVYSSEVVTAEDALRLGIVTKVYADDELERRVAELVGRLSSTADVSLVTVKRYLRLARGLDPLAGAGLASALLAGALASGAGKGSGSQKAPAVGEKGDPSKGKPRGGEPKGDQK